MEKIPKLRWRAEEDDMLRVLVQLHEGKRWKLVASYFAEPPRTFTQCHNRWSKVLDPTMSKGPWTAQEDEELLRLLSLHPVGAKINWNRLCGPLRGRNGKQARERWFNHLNPSVDKRAFTLEEDATLLREYLRVGTKWTEISRALAPGRTENRVKNHFNASMRRKIRGCTEFDEAWERYVAPAKEAKEKKKPRVSRKEKENEAPLQATDEPNPFASPCSRGHNHSHTTPTANHHNPRPLYGSDWFASPQML